MGAKPLQSPAAGILERAVFLLATILAQQAQVWTQNSFTGSCYHPAQLPQAEAGTRKLPMTKKAQQCQRKSGQGWRSPLLLLVLLSQPVPGP